MLDYKNGKIYQVVCNITGETYVGSTCKSLKDRLAEHKICNDCCSKQIIQRGNYYIDLLENYPCENRYELYRKEGEYQKSIKCINKIVAGRTHKEYYQEHKEQKVKYQQDNKEKIKARVGKIIICECGSKSTQHHLARHKLTKKHIDLMNKITSPSNYLSVEEKVV